RYLAPVHCTGEPAFAILKETFGDRYIYAGLGTTVLLGPKVTVKAEAGQPYKNAMDEEDLRSYREAMMRGPLRGLLGADKRRTRGGHGRFAASRTGVAREIGAGPRRLLKRCGAGRHTPSAGHRGRIACQAPSCGMCRSLRGGTHTALVPSANTLSQGTNFFFLVSRGSLPFA